VDGLPAPARKDEYLFYQTLVGVWPLEAMDDAQHQRLIERLQTYMAKATREAKETTSWVNPHPDYDAAVADFVARVLERRRNNRFLELFRTFHDQVMRWGLHSALSQTLLKLASPGIPDIYQGQEIWDFSLVDPDNRRKVDYDLRQHLLGELQEAFAKGADSYDQLVSVFCEHPQDNRCKLLVTWRTLELRRQFPDLFARGLYVPLWAAGEQSNHVCAFARRPEDADADSDPTVVVVVPRLLAQLTPIDEGHPTPRPPVGREVWGDTHLTLADALPSSLVNVFTGETLHTEHGVLRIAEALGRFPVALFVSQPLRQSQGAPDADEL
jgi:(1->4)-alpha-D-glucan 1-alpha-D-glucosylmutase